MGTLEQLFSFVCGQDPAHTWAPGGESLPCCQRCTGLYAGIAIGLVLQSVLRMRPSARFLQVHGLFLLMMVPLGFHWVAHGELVRTVSGLLFGVGVVSFLWLFPGERLRGVHDQRSGDQFIYATGLGASLVLVPLIAVCGGRGGAGMLAVTSLIGLGGLAVLMLANMGIGIAAMLSRSAKAGAGPAR